MIILDYLVSRIQDESLHKREASRSKKEMGDVTAKQEDRMILGKKSRAKECRWPQMLILYKEINSPLESSAGVSPADTLTLTQ